MRYEKPEVVVLGDAASAIQGSSNKALSAADAQPSNATTNAYEADE